MHWLVHMRGLLVTVQSDNTMVVVYINRQGATSGRLAQNEADLILSWAESHILTLSTIHISGRQSS